MQLQLSHIQGFDLVFRVLTFILFCAFEKFSIYVDALKYGKCYLRGCVTF